jgi:hypothetical protein
MIQDLPRGTTPQPEEVVRQFVRDTIDLAEKSGMPFGQCLIAFGVVGKSIARMYADQGGDHAQATHFVLSCLMEGLGFQMESIDDEGPVH